MDNGREDRLSGIDKIYSFCLYSQHPVGAHSWCHRFCRVGDDVIWQSGMPTLAGRVCSYVCIRNVLQEERQRVCATATHEHFLLPFIPYTLCDAVAHWAQIWSVKKMELPPREICSFIFLPLKWEKKETQTSDVSGELTYIVEISSIFIKDVMVCVCVCVWAWIWVRVGLGR